MKNATENAYDEMVAAMKKYYEQHKEGTGDCHTPEAALIGAVLNGIACVVDTDDTLENPASKAFFNANSAWMNEYFWKPLDDWFDLVDVMDGRLAKAESPIETAFMNALIGLGYLEEFEPQYKWNQYRLDIAFPALKVAVELDGHEFHSSKEARNRDTVRDRKLLSGGGWKVVRFTGSQVFQDAGACASELHGLIEGWKVERTPVTEE